ncbi:MAG TPA: carboxypeptidase regulatory-like domain-containing protein [Verrucomicrobiae bacterium]|nr:carboxypeptidase regulatory-like domain-containing protein [Verrucomicrobiae bacterium]
MRKQIFLVSAIATVAVCLFFAAAGFIRAANSPDIALTGQVSSTEEGPMEGVLVSAKTDGSTVTITVISDQQGRYRFPAAKLAPGEYSISIRAIGYELEGGGAAKIIADKTANVDLKLKKTQDLAAQLTSAEWIASVPGTTQQKNIFLNCMGCHTVERIMRSKYDTAGFIQALPRMANYANMSTPLHPQPRLADRSAATSVEAFKRQAEYLSTVNLSSASSWQFPLKTLPRPTGRATRVIITEYDLPRPTVEPHDVIVDQQGTVWYSNFGEQYLGKLNPKTAKVTEYSVPLLKKGSPTGMLDLQPDKDGNLWLALMYQGGIAKFDKQSEKFQVWAIPPELNNDTTQQSMVMPAESHVDGKVWMTDVDRRALHRLDLASGKFETFDLKKILPTDKVHSAYGIKADSQNNLYFMDFSDQNIGRIDAKTGKATLYPTPTPNSRPRRGMMDAQGQLWFAEYGGNRVGMLDTKTERIQEWEVPTPWTAPYDVTVDKNGELWSGTMSTDRVLRLDPKSGRSTEYLLPRTTNMRRVFVDNSTTPLTFWVGNNHGASIIKLEPLD